MQELVQVVEVPAEDDAHALGIGVCRLGQVLVVGMVEALQAQFLGEFPFHIHIAHHGVGPCVASTVGYAQVAVDDQAVIEELPRHGYLPFRVGVGAAGLVIDTHVEVGAELG